MEKESSADDAGLSDSELSFRGMQLLVLKSEIPEGNCPSCCRANGIEGA